MAALALLSLSCPYKIDGGNEKSSSLTSTQALKKPSSSLGIKTWQFPVNLKNQIGSLLLVHATLNSPKGFGPPPKNNKKTKSGDEEDEEEEESEAEAGVIPEVVTNRMISRMGLSVGIPLFIGLLFFPFFYYLKIGLKIDVPTWVPLIVSFFFFGTALLGISYGIVSSSWDPMREGSLLGWNEAQKNWPAFWQSIWGGSRWEQVGNTWQRKDKERQGVNTFEAAPAPPPSHEDMMQEVYDPVNRFPLDEPSRDGGEDVDKMILPHLPMMMETINMQFVTLSSQ
ncbi:protein PAM68, chloroplastic-like [Hibiscus syriacus]|uniref:protein PAM68, chloroplastic-like n=1 Tax=Hibiscus syriacus TaxID=106335 RepID=UPI001921D0CC|nr:protein PAM68, chloroplastic-like [Hibiscus syriacus]